MLPEAPTRFSTTTGCPQRAASFSLTMRGSASAAPPAGNGTMTRIGRPGYPGAGSCAHAEAARSKPASHAYCNEFIASLRRQIGPIAMIDHAAISDRFNPLQVLRSIGDFPL